MDRPDLKEVEAALKWADELCRPHEWQQPKVLAAECRALREALDEVSKMGEIASAAAFRWEKAFQAETLARSQDIAAKDEIIKYLETKFRK